jgi:hypothetical protein
MLESRILLASDIPSSIIQVTLPPGQVAASNPSAPVTIHLPAGDSTLPPIVVSTGDQQLNGVLGPGDGINLYRIDVGPATGSLELDLTWETLPQGGSASFLVFDAGGDLLIDQAATGGANSLTISSGAQVPATGTAFYLAILVPGPAGASTAAGQYTYNVRITSSAPAPVSPCGVPAIWGGSSGTGSVSSSSGVVVVLASEESGSSGPGQPITAQHGGSAQGPWPSRTTSTATGAAPTTPERSSAQSTARPTTSIDVSPLPTSRYEPAGGIFDDGGAPEAADRVEATRLDMSLIRLSAPRWDGSLDDEPSSEPDAATVSSPGVDTPVASPTVLVSRGDQTSSHEPRPFRSGERIAVRPLDVPFAAPPLLDADGLLGGMPRLSAATLPPIDGSDRPSSPTPSPSRDEETVDPSPPEWASGRSGAILLGLGGSAVLGVGLYAPDLAAVFRRALARRMPKLRPRPTSSRDHPACE